jgi:REP element-mobilizing transposase RayT
MAGQLRIQFPGALYHITHRGNERKSIFSYNKDKETFLDLLSFVIDVIREYQGDTKDTMLFSAYPVG